MKNGLRILRNCGRSGLNVCCPPVSRMGIIGNPVPGRHVGSTVLSVEGDYMSDSPIEKLFANPEKYGFRIIEDGPKWEPDEYVPWLWVDIYESLEVYRSILEESNDLR